MLVLPSTGEYELVDENDLKLALKMNKSLKSNIMKPYMIAHQLMIEINENFDDVNNRIMYCYNKMVGKLKKPNYNKTYKNIFNIISHM